MSDSDSDDSWERAVAAKRPSLNVTTPPCCPMCQCIHSPQCNYVYTDFEYSDSSITDSMTRATPSEAPSDAPSASEATGVATATASLLSSSIMDPSEDNSALWSHEEDMTTDNEEDTEETNRDLGNTSRVNTGLTTAQIAMLPQSHYIPKKDEFCAVCMADIEPGQLLTTLPCLHRLHTRCVERWLKITAKCPVCRHSLAQHLNI